MQYDILQVKNRFKAAVNNFLGTSEFGGFDKIGLTNVYDILQKAENLETEYSVNYAEQKGIGCKPTLCFTGEELKKYSIPLKLHAAFCNVDDIISALEQKAKEQEVFPLYRKNGFLGRFVITSVHKNIINAIDDITIYAEVSVDITEYYDDETTEYTQQAKTNDTTNFDMLSKVQKSVNKAVVKYVPKPAQNIFERLTDSAIKTAVRESEGWINSNTWGRI